jgi:hypothetical protein
MNSGGLSDHDVGATDVIGTCWHGSIDTRLTKLREGSSRSGSVGRRQRVSHAPTPPCLVWALPRVGLRDRTSAS